ncbi:MAG: TolC family protein [Planctomycetota bacterium]|nr:TolC family protein [Planctomycetota bacterium]
MSRPFQTAVAFLLIALTVCTGCHPTQPFFASQDNDLSHYLDKATQSEYPDVDTATLADAKESKDPLTVSNPEFDSIWDVSLEECIAITLKNSKTIRNLGGVTPFGMADALVGRSGTSSVYDTALQETNGSGNPQATDSGGGIQQSLASRQGGLNGSFFYQPERPISGIPGVEVALSEFDANLFANSNIARQDNPQNNIVGATAFPSVTDNTTGGMTTGIQKKTATGASFQVSNSTNYMHWTDSLSPKPSYVALQDFWQTQFDVRWDQPLLRGRGTQINRIPLMLARINTDISLSEFQSMVRNLIMDVENTYWDLHLAYRNLETAKISRDSAQIAWRIARGKNPGPGSAAEEAQATEQYFNFRGMVETSLRELYNKENQLRFLMGLAATDGRLIRPVDEPTMAKVTFDWCVINAESLQRSPELLKQKWAIKQDELILVGMKNRLLPRLDVGAQYRWLGAGNNLINSDSSGLRFDKPGSNAFETLTRGDYQEFSVLGTFEMPIGFRRELAAVRHSQLMLARNKARLEDMELNTTHLLGTAVRNVDGNYGLIQTHFNRWSAAETEVNSLRAQYEGGKITLYELLDSQRRRAQAQGDFHKAVTEYSKSIAEVHFRKGSLLDYNNVALSEGAWPQKAQWDALERARERDASYYLDYGFTRPNVVSLGPVPQGAAMSGSPISSIVPGQPTPADGGPVPAEMPAEKDLGQPGEGGSILNKPEPAELGPVTGDSPLPVLNAPATRTADSGMVRSIRQSQKSSFDWDTLDLDAKSGPAPAKSGVVPAGYSTQIGDHR